MREISEKLENYASFDSPCVRSSYLLMDTHSCCNLKRPCFLLACLESDAYFLGFPGGSVVKNLPAMRQDPGSIPGLGRSPGEANGNPLQYSCLENPMDRNLEGYSPWGHKESDMTEKLTLSHCISFVFSPRSVLFASGCFSNLTGSL